MLRINRIAIGDTVYLIINRANGRATIFKTKRDYAHWGYYLLFLILSS